MLQLGGLVTYLSSLSGLGEDIMRLVVAMIFISYPFGLLLKYIPSNTPILGVAADKFKHSLIIGTSRRKEEGRTLFVTVIGLIMAYWVYGILLLHTVGTTLISYWILVSQGPSRRTNWLIFGFLMAYLCGGHIHRMVYHWGEWTLDWTTPQMILTIKMTSLIFNAFDGKRFKEEKPEPREKELKEISLEEFPSFLEIFAFIIFPMTYYAGPALEMKYYLNYIRGVQELDEHGKPIPIPSTIWPAFKKFIFSCILLAMFLFADTLFPPAYTASLEYAARPLWQRLSFLWSCALGARCKYYWGWKVAEGGCVLCGFGWRREDGKDKWDRCKQAEILKVEASGSTRDILANWNIMTARWLKNTVYLRVGNKAGNRAILATSCVSAFWHGFYPGYYLTFINLGVGTSVGRFVHKSIRPFFHNTRWGGYLYDGVSLVVAHTLVDVLGVVFLLLDHKRAFAFYKAVLYFPVVAMGGALVLKLLWPKKPKKE